MEKGAGCRVDNTQECFGSPGFDAHASFQKAGSGRRQLARPQRLLLALVAEQEKGQPQEQYAKVPSHLSHSQDPCMLWKDFRRSGLESQACGTSPCDLDKSLYFLRTQFSHEFKEAVRPGDPGFTVVLTVRS